VILNRLVDPDHDLGLHLKRKLEDQGQIQGIDIIKSIAADHIEEVGPGIIRRRADQGMKEREVEIEEIEEIEIIEKVGQVKRMEEEMI
jgi:hypothetical protein